MEAKGGGNERSYYNLIVGEYTQRKKGFHVYILGAPIDKRNMVWSHGSLIVSY